MWICAVVFVCLCLHVRAAVATPAAALNVALWWTVWFRCHHHVKSELERERRLLVCVPSTDGTDHLRSTDCLGGGALANWVLCGGSNSVPPQMKDTNFVLANNSFIYSKELSTAWPDLCLYFLRNLLVDSSRTHNGNRILECGRVSRMHNTSTDSIVDFVHAQPLCYCISICEPVNLSPLCWLLLR